MHEEVPSVESKEEQNQTKAVGVRATSASQNVKGGHLEKIFKLLFLC